MENCGLCSQKFNGKKEIRNHMMAEHGGMKVICPWCPEERVYKRVPDLKAHAKQAHPHQLSKYPAEFILESNCIWFSLDPVAYRKVAEGSSWASTTATQARVLVLDWLGKVKRSSRRKSEWQQGWEQVKNVEVADVLYPELLFEPDYDENEAAYTPKPEEYCPSNPHVEDLEVEHVDLTRKKIAIRQGRQVFSISLSDRILEDVKSLTSITRKMSVQNRREEPPFKRRRLVDSTTIRSRLIKFIGVEAQYVERVEENIREPVSRPPIKRKERSPEHCTPERSALQMSSAKRKERSPKPISLERSALPTSIAKRKERSPEPCTPERPTLPTYSACKPTEAANIPDILVRPRGSDLSERAKELVMKGCLPLFPPARRDWDRKQVILTAGDLKISWPPHGWRDLTPDRRLLSWEFTALTLQQSMDPDLSVIIERTDLLDKFNFLALPGTVEKVIRKSDQVKRKTRYYIYEQLKQIANGERDGDETWIRMVERSCALRDRSTDRILESINEADIPVRL